MRAAPDLLQHAKVNYTQLVRQSDGVKSNQAVGRVLVHDGIWLRLHLGQAHFRLLQSCKGSSILKHSCKPSHTKHTRCKRTRAVTAVEQVAATTRAGSC